MAVIYLTLPVRRRANDAFPKATEGVRRGAFPPTPYAHETSAKVKLSDSRRGSPCYLETQVQVPGYLLISSSHKSDFCRVLNFELKSLRLVGSPQ